MAHEKSKGKWGQMLVRAARLTLVLAVALSAHWYNPLPALADTGSTQLYVEREAGDEHAASDTSNADQKRATVASAQASPQTGDDTEVALVAVLAAGGVGATILGSAMRRRRRSTLPTIPYGTGAHRAPREVER